MFPTIVAASVLFNFGKMEDIRENKIGDTISIYYLICPCPCTVFVLFSFLLFLLNAPRNLDLAVLQIILIFVIFYHECNDI